LATSNAEASPTSLIDFGHYIINDKVPFFNIIDGKKGDPLEIVADKDAAIPFGLWGYDPSIPPEPGVNWFYADKDKPSIAGYQIARKYLATLNADGNDMAREKVWKKYFLRFIGPVRERLKQNPW
jgi:hypothetical protein